MRRTPLFAIAGIALAVTVGAAAQAGQGPAPGGKPVVLRYQDMVVQGPAIVRRGKSSSVRMQRMIEQARKAADIIRVTCLDDKLTQVHANLKTAEARLKALKTAVDPGRRQHEHTVIIVVGQKLLVLDREAQQCIGEQLFETGATRITTEIDADLPQFEKDPSNPPIVLPPGVPTIPDPASGIR
jgi:hypothetical protein